MKTRRTIDAVAIEQRHRRHIQIGAGCDQIFRQRSAFKKTESGTAVKFDIHLEHVSLTASHTSLPKSIFRLAGRAPGDKKRCHFLLAPQYPPRRAPILRAPTSLRRSARVRQSRESLPAFPYSWGR